MNKNSLGILLVALGLLSSCLKNDTFNSKIQLKNDIASIRSFLAKNNLKTDSTTEGIYYVIDTVGIGIYPVVSDSVKIQYTISSIPDLTVLYTSEKFDASTSKFQMLSSLIAGLQIGLPRFPVGSYGRIYVPSGLAFGTIGNSLSGVTPNANLLFTIKKLGSQKGNRFSTDTTAIVKFLNSIADTLLAHKRKVIKDPSGIRYWYDTLYAANIHPDLVNYPTMDVNYSARVLNAVHYYDSATSTGMALVQQIAAWKIILPQISQGSTVYMCVPSGYGYGSALNPKDTTLAYNSSLFFRVKLNKVY